MSAWNAVHGIVVRDLARMTRQRSRLLGGVARPLMWLLLVGTGFNAIARVEGAASYQEFVFPGVIAMASLFGATLTAVSTVYDREFGMLRLMLASPTGLPAVLAGRAAGAVLVGMLQGAVVLAFAPLITDITAGGVLLTLVALLLGSAATGMLGLVLASRLQSVENFAGVINVVLFPLLFVSGALYPTAAMPSVLRTATRFNPVTYQVDLIRHAFGQPVELSIAVDIIALAGFAALAFILATALFDAERRVARM